MAKAEKGDWHFSWRRLAGKPCRKRHLNGKDCSKNSHSHSDSDDIDHLHQPWDYYYWLADNEDLEVEDARLASSVQEALRPVPEAVEVLSRPVRSKSKYSKSDRSKLVHPRPSSSAHSKSIPPDLAFSDSELLHSELAHWRSKSASESGPDFESKRRSYSASYTESCADLGLPEIRDSDSKFKIEADSRAGPEAGPTLDPDNLNDSEADLDLDLDSDSGYDSDLDLDSDSDDDSDDEDNSPPGPFFYPPKRTVAHFYKQPARTRPSFSVKYVSYLLQRYRIPSLPPPHVPHPKHFVQRA